MPQTTNVAQDAPADPFSEPGMEDMRRDMLEMLARTSATDLQQLEQALADGDSQTARHTLHRTLGALQLFTNGRVISQGRDLMEALAGEGATQALQQLPAYLGDLRGVISDLVGDTGRT
jgi:hypothetical protein